MKHPLQILLEQKLPSEQFAIVWPILLNQCLLTIDDLKGVTAEQLQKLHPESINYEMATQIIQIVDNNIFDQIKPIQFGFVTQPKQNPNPKRADDDITINTLKPILWKLLNRGILPGTDGELIDLLKPLDLGVYKN